MPSPASGTSSNPSELRGRVVVVLAADPTAIIGHSAYVSPSDGKNMNRVWPGDPDGTLTERIAHLITTEYVSDAAAVIDVHGGEWDEDIDCFIITHRSGDAELDQRTVDLAMALGFTYVEVTDADGPVLGAGTGSGEAVRGGRPGITLEAGGAGERRPEYIDSHVHALWNALRHLDIIEGDPVMFDGAPVLLDHGVLMKTTRRACTCRRFGSVSGWRRASCSLRSVGSTVSCARSSAAPSGDGARRHHRPCDQGRRLRGQARRPVTRASSGVAAPGRDRHRGGWRHRPCHGAGPGRSRAARRRGRCGRRRCRSDRRARGGRRWERRGGPPRRRRRVVGERGRGRGRCTARTARRPDQQRGGARGGGTGRRDRDGRLAADAPHQPDGCVPFALAVSCRT
jgi:hypothetical protein